MNIRDRRFDILARYIDVSYNSDNNVRLAAKRHHARLLDELRLAYVGKPIHSVWGDGICRDVRSLGSLELELWDDGDTVLVNAGTSSVMPDSIVELALDDPPPGV